MVKIDNLTNGVINHDEPVEIWLNTKSGKIIYGSIEDEGTYMIVGYNCTNYSEIWFVANNEFFVVENNNNNLSILLEAGFKEKCRIVL